MATIDRDIMESAAALSGAGAGIMLVRELDKANGCMGVADATAALIRVALEMEQDGDEPAACGLYY